MRFGKELFKVISDRSFLARVFVTLGVLFLYRLGQHIPVPGFSLAGLTGFFQNLGVLSFLSGLGSRGGSSVFALGVLPYINASIIVQLGGVAIPSIKELLREGEHGRLVVARYTRYLTFGLAVVQSVFLVASEHPFGTGSFLISLYGAFIFTAGAVLVLWFSEFISEFGLGNGASMLIFFGIVGGFPQIFQEAAVKVFGGEGALMGVLVVLFLLAMVYSIVVLQRGERRVPVEYARSARAGSLPSRTYIPFKVIQGGVMPIIFASAVVHLPFVVANFPGLSRFEDGLSRVFSPVGLPYNFVFGVLILVFGLFYVAVVMEPKDISDNLRKHGGVIIGIRPGESTEVFLEGVLTRLAIVGGVVLAAVAISPSLFFMYSGMHSVLGIGGIGLLIAVGVGLDCIRQVEGMAVYRRLGGAS